MSVRFRGRPGRTGAVAALLALVLAAPGARAQVSGSNLLLGQSGNVPFRDPTDRTGLYDQLNLELPFSGGRVGVRFETDQNSTNSFIYHTVTQRFAEWSDERVRVRVGNLYTLLGRGLVHRSFEVPGVVLDQPGIQSRYGFTRDLDGALIEGVLGPVSARLVSGQPNGGDTSPGIDPDGTLRYRGQSTGGEASVRLPRAARVGSTFTRFTNTGADQQALGSGFLEVDPLGIAGVRSVALPLYFEYAQQDGDLGDWARFRTGPGVPHALYASANLLWRQLAFSAEWKDYRSFRFGTNDPPSLVREHGWALLNRATHVLNADGERGFQIEGSGSLPALGALVLNLSRSDSPAGRRFEERFAELRIAPERRPWEGTVFIDNGRDEFAFVQERSTAGAGATVRLPATWAASADFEQQHTRRDPDRFTDQRASLTASRADWGSASLLWERSTDPAQWDPAQPGRARRFIAGVVSARLSERHEATLFWGERRGGRACTAGTCYEVAPFRGMELRMTSRF